MKRDTREEHSSYADRRPGRHPTRLILTATAGVLVALAVLGAVLIVGANSTQESRIKRKIGALLAGIPQDGQTLGAPSAPVTLQVFAELEDSNSQRWFFVLLPSIINDFVRTGRLRIEYRSFKTNTLESETFVKQQAAALAAGAQDKLWNFAYIFYSEQGVDRTPYVTEGFLHNIASQVPALNITKWDEARNADWRAEQVVEEDQRGRAEGIHVTPAYRIGRTGGALKSLSGSISHVYSGQIHPTTYASAEDIAKAISQIR
jgi:hypothetical protein